MDAFLRDKYQHRKFRIEAENKEVRTDDPLLPTVSHRPTPLTQHEHAPQIHLSPDVIRNGSREAPPPFTLPQTSRSAGATPRARSIVSDRPAPSSTTSPSCPLPPALPPSNSARESARARATSVALIDSDPRTRKDPFTTVSGRRLTVPTGDPDYAFRPASLAQGQNSAVEPPEPGPSSPTGPTAGHLTFNPFFCAGSLKPSLAPIPSQPMGHPSVPLGSQTTTNNPFSFTPSPSAHSASPSSSAPNHPFGIARQASDPSTVSLGISAFQSPGPASTGGVSGNNDPQTSWGGAIPWHTPAALALNPPVALPSEVLGAQAFQSCLTPHEADYLGPSSVTTGTMPALSASFLGQSAFGMASGENGCHLPTAAASGSAAHSHPFML